MNESILRLVRLTVASDSRLDYLDSRTIIYTRRNISHEIDLISLRESDDAQKRQHLRTSQASSLRSLDHTSFFHSP
jgi:hypothetical protein